MGSTDSTGLQQQLQPLLVFLRTLEGPQADQAMRAYKNLLNDIDQIENHGASTDCLSYSLSGKGLFDWYWPEEILKQLHRLADQVWWSTFRS